MTIKGPEAYCLRLSRLETNQKEIAGKAIFAGAKIVADKIRSNINAIPEDKYRRLKPGEKYGSVTKREKRAILACFGVSPLKVADDGSYNVKVGVDDYVPADIIAPTEKYPRGIPAAMLLRSVESGSSVRQKHPTVRPAVNAVKAAAENAMRDVMLKEINKTMEG